MSSEMKETREGEILASLTTMLRTVCGPLKFYIWNVCFCLALCASLSSELTSPTDQIPKNKVAYLSSLRARVRPSKPNQVVVLSNSPKTK